MALATENARTPGEAVVEVLVAPDPELDRCTLAYYLDSAEFDVQFVGPA